MKKRKKKQNRETPSPKKLDPRTLRKMILLLLVTAVVFSVYRLLMAFSHFEIVLIAYMILASALVLTYLIYNRGLSRNGVTEEMLPESWSKEQKAAFIEDGKRRLQKSRWMLIPIFAFFFTFAWDALELIVFPLFSKMLFG